MKHLGESHFVLLYGFSKEDGEIFSKPDNLSHKWEIENKRCQKNKRKKRTVFPQRVLEPRET